ncbi:ABC transporter ATP-binding protein [Bilophila wadsworthia]|uniref:ABC transporter ATP-binding protein n=1 Tax=Bilophila wadsworthia TaxID=35833 RepID=UPI0026671831|nr:ABC transporter ATP-binding protein [Bilophila wadsworthia]
MLQGNILALKWLYRLAQGRRSFLFLSVLLSILSGGAGLVPLWFFYRMSVPLLQGQSLSEPIWQLPAAALAAIALRYVLQYISWMLAHAVAFHIYGQLRRNIISHMGGLPLGFFSARSSGAIRRIMGEDIENLEIFIAHHVPDLARALAVPFIIFGILIPQSVPITICVFIPLLLAWIALAAIHRIQTPKMKAFHDNLEKMNTAIVEYIKSMPIVKIFNITMKSYLSLYNAIQNQVRITSGWVRDTTPFFVLFRIGIGCAILFLMPCAVWLLQDGEFDPALWLFAFMLATAMVGHLEQIYTSSSLLSSLSEGMRRIDELLTAEPLTVAAQPVSPDRFDVEFQGVGFSYGGSTTADDALNDVAMTLEERKIHAFVGESGSGKTTAAQLLLRFWDVERGAIRIGGKDIRDIPLEELMSLVSFVFQDTFIQSASVAENIKLGRPEATDGEVIEAAKLAQAHDFIQALDNGYDTQIGQEGVHLSGGEKQRISIARALLKDSPILVLDEATSSTDPENELDISRAIRALAGKKTLILITHKLSTAIFADQILVFSHGRLAGSGTHESLLWENSEYQRIWKNAAPFSKWVLATEKAVPSC